MAAQATEYQAGGDVMNAILDQLSRQNGQIRVLFGHHEQFRAELAELSEVSDDVGHVAEQVQELAVHKDTASDQLQFLFVKSQETFGKVNLLSTKTDECFDKVSTRVSRLSNYTEHVATGLGQVVNDVSDRVDGISAHYRELEAQIDQLTSIFNRLGVEDLTARLRDVIQDLARVASNCAHERERLFSGCSQEIERLRVRQEHFRDHLSVGHHQDSNNGQLAQSARKTSVLYTSHSDPTKPASISSSRQPMDPSTPAAPLDRRVPSFAPSAMAELNDGSPAPKYGSREPSDFATVLPGNRIAEVMSSQVGIALRSSKSRSLGESMHAPKKSLPQQDHQPINHGKQENQASAAGIAPPQQQKHLAPSEAFVRLFHDGARKAGIKILASSSQARTSEVIKDLDAGIEPCINAQTAETQTVAPEDVCCKEAEDTIQYTHTAKATHSLSSSSSPLAPPVEQVRKEPYAGTLLTDGAAFISKNTWNPDMGKDVQNNKCISGGIWDSLDIFEQKHATDKTTTTTTTTTTATATDRISTSSPLISIACNSELVPWSRVGNFTIQLRKVGRNSEWFCLLMKDWAKRTNTPVMRAGWKFVKDVRKNGRVFMRLRVPGGNNA
ncbi:MAG: hypothetical protein Q9201_002991 [Fulgogasparrea decipioides]